MMKGLPLLPRSVSAPSGHKCLGAFPVFEVGCECGWYSLPHKERRHAYSEWREHARTHGGVVESYEEHAKREAAYRRKLEAQ
ncbi:hypothetical protein M2321_003938 [Rhodoblastus acidophilus]|nr:hypothetical protein [Rhodoblastus acidophilus]